MSKPVRQPDEESSFEDAMQRLNEIISAMEDDRMPLAEMIQSYSEGMQLLKVCRQHIEVARHRVELISADLDAGKATTRPFGGDSADETPDADEASPRQSPPKRRKTATDEEIRLF
ncbi:MAG: exodeoxyribonuclease VII small subunit [Verrucomicrobiaceae bacterium]|nr:exodeoxyribonuclease VII small subunit [Verrucomicrobiaceae bacterium]